MIPQTEVTRPRLPPLGAAAPATTLGTSTGPVAALSERHRGIRVPDPAERVSAELLAGLPEDLRASAATLYGALHRVALRVGVARGYSRGVTQVSYHAPAEVVAAACGMNRATLYRALPVLQQAGLVDARGHKTTFRGRTVADGTVWSVKMIPSRGRAARVRYEDLKHKWRDLAWDVEHGRTAYLQLRQSYPRGQGHHNDQLILDWALPPGPAQPALSKTVAPRVATGLPSVLDVPYAPRGQRSHAVNAAALACCTALGDQSVGFYRWLLWQALRLHDQGRDWFPALHDMLQRAAADNSEGYATRAGALLVVRLRECGLWEVLRAAPPWRVA